MSAKFVDLLERLGFSDSLDASSFDWMFFYEESKPLLSWICDNIGVENLITPKELEL